MASEFKQFLDTLKRLGIQHTISWELRDPIWQKAVDKAGYSISALGCFLVRIDNIDYVFSKGQAHWDNKENGYGPRGAFMFSRNWVSGKLTNRTLFVADVLFPDCTGLEALKAAYPDQF